MGSRERAQGDAGTREGRLGPLASAARFLLSGLEGSLRPQRWLNPVTSPLLLSRTGPRVTQARWRRATGRGSLQGPGRAGEVEDACAVHRTPSQGGGPHGLWTGSQSGRAAVEGTPFLYGPQVPVSCAPPGASCPSNDSNSNSNRGNNDKNRYIFYRLSTARNLATYEAERIFLSLI